MDPRRVPSSHASFTIRRVSYHFRRVQRTEQHYIRDGSSGVFSPAENVPSYPTPASRPTEQHGIRDGSSGVFSHAENVPSNPPPVFLTSTPSVDPRASASQVTLHPGSVPTKRERPWIHPRRAVDQRTTSSPLPGPSSSPSADAPLPDQPVPRKRGRTRGRSRNALGNAGRNFMTHILIIGSGEDVVQKIMSFVEIAKNACILSATGTVYGVSLFHLDNAGGSVSYEGCHEILSLSGTFVDKTPVGASFTGGLAICLSSSSGHLVGGLLDGPLTAVNRVQVTLGSF